MDIQGYGIPDDHPFLLRVNTKRLRKHSMRSNQCVLLIRKDQGGELGRACQTKGETSKKG